MLTSLPASVASWPTRMLKIREVVMLTGVDKSTIYDWMSKDQFPLARRLGPHRVGWLAADIEKWCRERPTIKTAA